MVVVRRSWGPRRGWALRWGACAGACWAALIAGCQSEKAQPADDGVQQPADSGAADGGLDGVGEASGDGGEGDGGGDGGAEEALSIGPVQSCAAPRSTVAYVEHSADLGFLRRDDDTDQHLAGSSLIVDDFDEDGDLDIVQGLEGSALRIYWAEGEGYRPEDLTPTSAMGRLRPFDGDGDGRTDVVTLSPPSIWARAEGGLAPGVDFRGFGARFRGMDAQPLDLNGDGAMDFFIPGNSPFDDPEARRDFVIFGSEGSEVRVEPLPGFEATGNAAQGSAIDWDGDGDLDVMVTNDMGFMFGGNRLWINEGGALSSAAAEGCLPTFSGMAHAFGDYDRDGVEDLFVGATLEGRLLRREADGTCIDYSRATGADPLLSRSRTMNPMIWSSAFLDFDNDGRLDLVHTEGDLYNGEDGLPRYEAPIDLMQQQADGTFVDVSAALGLSREGSHRAVVPDDLNGDGVLDLVVADVEAPLRLYLSTGCTAAAWLRVEAPEQTTVEVEAGDARWVAVARAEVSVSGFRRPLVHVGLGAVETIDRVTLRPLVGEPVVIEGPLEPRRALRWTP